MPSEEVQWACAIIADGWCVERRSLDCGRHQEGIKDNSWKWSTNHGAAALTGAF